MEIKEKEIQEKKNLHHLIVEISKFEIKSFVLSKELNSQFDFCDGQNTFGGFL